MVKDKYGFGYPRLKYKGILSLNITSLGTWDLADNLGFSPEYDS